MDVYYIVSIFLRAFQGISRSPEICPQCTLVGMICPQVIFDDQSASTSRHAWESEEYDDFKGSGVNLPGLNELSV